MAISRIRWRLHIAKKIEDSKKGVACAEDETDESDETDVGTCYNENNRSQHDPAPGPRNFFYPEKLLEGVEKGCVVSDIITSNGGHFPDHSNKACFSSFHPDLVRFIWVLRNAYIGSTNQNLPVPDLWPPASVPVGHSYPSQFSISKIFSG
jgi:hypothetical protein